MLVDVGASGEVGRTVPGIPSDCFVLVVVRPFGTAADEGETLSSAAWPAGLCSLLEGAVDTPAAELVRGSLGNPRKAG